MAGPSQTEQRAVWYFSMSKGWMFEREPADAKYRLTAIGRTASHVQVQNNLEVVNPRGGWMEIPAENEKNMPAVERGFVFEVKPVQIGSAYLMQITSKRYIDAEILSSILEGIELFDKYGEPLSQPEKAFDTICVPRMQFDLVADRIRTIGAQITESQADLQSMYETLQSLQGIRTEMEQLCTLSRTAIERISEGIRTDAPLISERSRTAHYLRDQAAEKVDFIRSEKMALDQQPGAIEEKGYGAAYLQNAEEWLGGIEKLHREHKSYEIQAVSRIQEAISQSLPSLDAPASTRRFLFMPVVEHYTELGYDCRLVPEGMILRLPDCTIELAEAPRVLGGNSEPKPATAPQAIGERGARE